MTVAPPPTAAQAPAPATGRVQAWIRTHRPQAAFLGAAVAVVAFVVVRRRVTGSTAAAGAASTAAATDASTAGLTGTPDTDSSDIENEVQDQLNQLAASVDAQLAASGTPAAPTPVAAAPKPSFQGGSAALADKYTFDQLKNQYYQVQSNGSLVPIAYAQWAAVKAIFGSKPPPLVTYNLKPVAKPPATIKQTPVLKK